MTRCMCGCYIRCSRVIIADDRWHIYLLSLNSNEEETVNAHAWEEKNETNRKREWFWPSSVFACAFCRSYFTFHRKRKRCYMFCFFCSVWFESIKMTTTIVNIILFNWFQANICCFSVRIFLFIKCVCCHFIILVTTSQTCLMFHWIRM